MSADEATRIGEPMVGFGGKQAWLAIRGSLAQEHSEPSGPADADLVSALLGLHDLGAVSWRAGMDLAYFTDDRVVLTPPLPGAGGTTWLLVAGRWLTQPRSTVDVEGLSDALATEVQYFATDRTLQRHCWRRARDGVLLRSFDFLGGDGELLDWQGEPDEAERAIGLPAAPDEAALLVGEGDVLWVAAAWSIDPTALDGEPSPGPLRAAAVS